MTGSLGETALSVFHDQLAVNFLGAVSVTKGKHLVCAGCSAIAMHANVMQLYLPVSGGMCGCRRGWNIFIMGVTHAALLWKAFWGVPMSLCAPALAWAVAHVGVLHGGRFKRRRRGEWVVKYMVSRSDTFVFAVGLGFQPALEAAAQRGAKPVLKFSRVYIT